MPLNAQDRASEHPVQFTVRHDLRPGDLGFIVRLHGTLYAREYGFDATFEPYVAVPLAQCVLAGRPRDRLWIAESGERIVGCIAVVGASETEARLRWFLVDPSVRGRGLGRRLLLEAVSFSEEQGYESVFLWTVSDLHAAGHLYRSLGFRLVEKKPGGWGAEVIEEKYVLDLGAHPGESLAQRLRPLQAEEEMRRRRDTHLIADVKRVDQGQAFTFESLALVASACLMKADGFVAFLLSRM